MWLEFLSAAALLIGLFGFGMVRRDKTSSKQATDQRLRSWLARLVGRKPGARLAALWRAAGVSRGSVTYHLNVLERVGIITVDREHGAARFYTSGDVVQQAPAIAVLRGGGVGALVELVLDNPGRCQVELAKVLGIGRKTFREYVDRLQAEDLVEERRDRTKRRYYPTPRLEELARLMNRDFSEEFDESETVPE